MATQNLPADVRNATRRTMNDDLGSSPACHVLSRGHEPRGCEGADCRAGATHVIAWKDGGATSMQRHYVCERHLRRLTVTATYAIEWDD